MSIHLNIYKKVLLSALMLLFPLPALAQDQASVLADKLFSDKEEEAKQAYETLMRTPVPEVLPFLELRYDALVQTTHIVRLLDVAAPICDATCLPYIASALRHDRREVVIAACKAAKELGRSELRPALFDLLERNPDEEVRFFAVRALESVLSDDQYDALLATVSLDKPDAASLRILRMMPVSRMESFLSRAVSFAKNEYYSTSIIYAWNHAGKAELLFDALLSTHVSDLSAAEQEQTEIALMRLAPMVTSINPKRRAHLLALPEYYTEDIIQKSLILAPFAEFFPEIMRLVRTMPDVFTPDIAASIIERFPVQSVEALTELVLHDIPLQGGFSTQRLLDFSNPDAATYAFMMRLSEVDNASEIGLRATYSRDDDIVRLAVVALEKYAAQDAVKARLFALLGHHSVAESAAMVLPGDDLAAYILEDPTDDTIGARYYARWALARHVQRGGDVSPELLLEAQELSRLPRRHALPAIALLSAANIPIPEDVVQFSHSAQQLRLLSLCHTQSASTNILQDALDNQILKAQAYLCLIEEPDLLAKISFKDSVFANDILSSDPQIALRAMIVVQKLAQNQVTLPATIKPALMSRLYDDDERIVHNTLLALRAMHALPARDTLMTLYHRTRQPETRAFLAFLADVPTDLNEQVTVEQTTQSEHYYTRFLDQAYDILDRQNIATRFGFY